MSKQSAPFRMRYKFEPEFGSFTVEQAEEFGGGTDALFIASIIYPPDGSLSLQTFSIDGRNGGENLKPLDQFKVFVLLAKHLSRTLKQGTWQQLVADTTWAVTCDAMGTLSVTEEK